MAVNGPALAAVAAGSIFLYAGLKGKSILATVQSIVKGKAPASVPGSSPVPIAADIASAAAAAAASVTLGGTSLTTSPGASQNQATAKMLAISMGYSSWTTGQEWMDWVKLWNQESGWSITAHNPSGASGIAQNINGYSADYLQGNAQSQITWGINYIAGRYGSPSGAWAHEVADDWY